MMGPVEGTGTEESLPDGLERELRGALSEPLARWREVYESFSPVDVATGERHSRMAPPEDGCRRAAVLIPILLEPGGAYVVYTVRKGHLQDHAGQISFPGGGVEPGDESLLATALRETEEEINVPPDLVEVAGELEELYIGPSNFLVKPYVGLLPPGTELVIAPEEVEAVFRVPIKELMSPGVLRTVPWEREGRLYKVPVFAVGDDPRREIWGATAAMTGGLLARLGFETR